mgnify:CR=1 FL=1
MMADVMGWTLWMGALIINDIWGLQRDRRMARVIAAHHAPMANMHNRERANTNIDFMQDIAAFFTRSLAITAIFNDVGVILTRSR